MAGPFSSGFSSGFNAPAGGGGGPSVPLTEGNLRKELKTLTGKDLDEVALLRGYGATSGELVGALNEAAGTPRAEWVDLDAAIVAFEASLE